MNLVRLSSEICVDLVINGGSAECEIVRLEIGLVSATLGGGEEELGRESGLRTNLAIWGRESLTEGKTFLFSYIR